MLSLTSSLIKFGLLLKAAAIATEPAPEHRVDCILKSSISGEPAMMRAISTPPFSPLMLLQKCSLCSFVDPTCPSSRSASTAAHSDEMPLLFRWSRRRVSSEASTGRHARTPFSPRALSLRSTSSRGLFSKALHRVVNASSATSSTRPAMQSARLATVTESSWRRAEAMSAAASESKLFVESLTDEKEVSPSVMGLASSAARSAGNTLGWFWLAGWSPP